MQVPPRERVRLHFIIVMIRWTGLAPTQPLLTGPARRTSAWPSAMQVEREFFIDNLLVRIHFNPEPSTPNPKLRTLTPKPEPLTP